MPINNKTRLGQYGPRIKYGKNRESGALTMVQAYSKKPNQFKKPTGLSGQRLKNPRAIRNDPFYNQNSVSTRRSEVDRPEFGRNDNPYSNKNIAAKAKRARANSNARLRNQRQY